MERSSGRSSAWLPRHPLFRLLVINGLGGAALGLLFVAGVLALDVAGIRSLLASTGEWVIGLSLLSIGSITTFASVAMGGAIMLLPRDPDDHDSGRREGEPVPVAVVAKRGAPGRSLRQ